MDKKEYLLLIEHELWASTRIAETLLKLEVIPDKAIRLMNHILGAQDTWICRIQNAGAGIGVFPDLQPSQWISTLRNNRERLIEILQADQALQLKVNYQNTKGDQFSNPVSELLLHLAMHAQYHRGQIIAYCREHIENPPATDLIAFLRL